MENNFNFNTRIDFEKIYNKENIANYLIEQTLSELTTLFVYENLPINIPSEFFEMHLLCNGKLAFFMLDGEYFVNTISLGDKPNYLYIPQKAIITNPYIKNIAERNYSELEKQAFLVRNSFFMRGELENIKQKVALLVDNFITQKVAVINKRVNNVFLASDETEKTEYMLYQKNIEKGKNSTIFKKQKNSIFNDETNNNPIMLTTNNDTNSFFKDLIEQYQYIKSQILIDYGINSIFNMKRENLNKNETETTQQQINTRINTMLHYRTIDIEKINEFYNLNIKVSINPKWGGGEVSERSDNLIQEETEGEENNSNSEME